MNVERINAVADAIEQHTIPDLGFNMHNYVIDNRERESDELIPDQSGHNCNTVACIAGWANAIRYKLEAKDSSKMSAWGDDSGAARWLGIDSDYDEYSDDDSLVDQLFNAHNHPEYRRIGFRAWKSISAEQAVRTLRNLAATGQVDWTV